MIEEVDNDFDSDINVIEIYLLSKSNEEPHG
jgi:hypothetical protein